MELADLHGKEAALVFTFRVGVHIIIIRPVEEHYHIGILLNSSGFTQIAQLRHFTAIFGTPFFYLPA